LEGLFPFLFYLKAYLHTTHTRTQREENAVEFRHIQQYKNILSAASCTRIANVISTKFRVPPIQHNQLDNAALGRRQTSLQCLHEPNTYQLADMCSRHIQSTKLTAGRTEHHLPPCTVTTEKALVYMSSLKYSNRRSKAQI